jgi:hypothetical protein
MGGRNRHRLPLKARQQPWAGGCHDPAAAGPGTTETASEAIRTTQEAEVDGFIGATAMRPALPGQRAGTGSGPVLSSPPIPSRTAWRIGMNGYCSFGSMKAMIMHLLMVSPARSI